MSYEGRLKIIEKLGSKRKFSLSIGSKETRFGSINLDIDSSTPDVIADARKLPFKSQIFELVFFTDVIEHLPKDDEIIALKEIFRVLRKGGEFVLSVPNNNRFLFTFLDPAFWIRGHRHYTYREIKELLEESGFEISTIGFLKVIKNVAQT
jgi:predicted SAM-dependent methyltransferase